LFCQERRKEPTEVLIETFIRKQLGLKAHTVTAVEQTETALVVDIDRLGKRRLRCGICRRPARLVHDVRRRRQWLDLSVPLPKV
jgi:hypothetical protein